MSVKIQSKNVALGDLVNALKLSAMTSSHSHSTLAPSLPKHARRVYWSSPYRQPLSLHYFLRFQRKLKNKSNTIKLMRTAFHSKKYWRHRFKYPFGSGKNLAMTFIKYILKALWIHIYIEKAFVVSRFWPLTSWIKCVHFITRLLVPSMSVCWLDLFSHV